MYLTKYLNKFSVIGSLVYGLLCGFTSLWVPEYNPVFGFIYSFVTATIFYFCMYILYIKYKKQIFGWRNNFLTKLVSLWIGFTLFILTGAVFYTVIFGTNFFVSADKFVTDISNVVYYIPFLP